MKTYNKKFRVFFGLIITILFMFISGCTDDIYVFDNNWVEFGNNNISFNGTTTIIGNQTVTDTITTNNLDLNNSLNISEFNISADNGFFNNLFVTNNITLLGYIINVTTFNINVTGNIDATGNITANDLLIHNLFANGRVTANFTAPNGASIESDKSVGIGIVRELGGINKGQVVYINDSSGDRPEVMLADANQTHFEGHPWGFASEDANFGDLIIIALSGRLKDFDTTNFTQGCRLHLGFNGNAICGDPPEGIHVELGQAIKINSNSGVIEIKIGEFEHTMRGTADFNVELGTGTDDSTSRINFKDGSRNVLGYMDGAGDFVWNGNIGIGTENPNTELYVNGSIITDNLNVSNDLWVKNTLGDWVYLPRHLETSVRFYNNLLLSELNCSMNGSVLTFYDANNESLIHNIGANETILDVKNGTFTLIEGTDNSPIENYVYYDTPGSDNIVVSVTEPTIDNAIIAKVLFGANYSYASLIDRTSPDTALTDIYDRFFDEGTLYISGFTPNATSNNVTITGGGRMKIIIDEHIHQGNFSLSDGYFFVLNNGTYVRSTDINDILQYGDGGIIGSRYFNIVWSLVHNDAQQVRLLATIQNEPPTEFITLDEAEADNRYTVFFETQNNLDKYGMPILRTVVRRLAGVNTIQQVNSGEYFLDVRGTTKATGAGGASPPITNHNELNNKEWSLAGHTIDATLDMNNNNITNTNNINANTLNVSTNATISDTLIVNNNVGIGTNNPETILDIDTNSNTEGIRLRGQTDTTDIADIYVGTFGELILTTKNGSNGNNAAFIDIIPNSNLFGMLLRDSQSLGGVTTPYANFFVKNGTTDYLNIVMNTFGTTSGLVVTQDEYVGIKTFSPVSDLDVNGTSTLPIIQGSNTSGDNLLLYSNSNNDGNVVTGYLGEEKITNGDFTGSSTGWTTSGNFAYDSNTMKATNATNNHYFQQSSAAMVTPIVIGEEYLFQATQTELFKVEGTTFNQLKVECSGTEVKYGWFENATYNAIFTATSACDLKFYVFEDGPGTYSARFDNVSLKRIIRDNHIVTNRLGVAVNPEYALHVNAEGADIGYMLEGSKQTSPKMGFRTTSQFGASTGTIEWDGSNEWWPIVGTWFPQDGIRMGGAGMGFWNYGDGNLRLQGGNSNLLLQTKTDNSKNTTMPYGNFKITRDNGMITQGTDDDVKKYWDGTNYIVDTNASGQNGLAWFSNNISATGYITRTEVWDENSSRAIDNLKSSNELLNIDGSINHSAFSESVTYKVKDLNNCSLVIVDYEYCGIYGYYNKTLNTIIYETEETCKPINDFPKYINSTKRPIYENVCEEKIEYGVNLGLMASKHEQALATFRSVTDVVEFSNVSALDSNVIMAEEYYTKSKTPDIDNVDYISKLKDKNKLKKKINTLCL